MQWTGLFGDAVPGSAKQVTREGKKHLNSFPTFLYLCLSLFVLWPPMTGHCLFNTENLKYSSIACFYQVCVQLGNINLEKKNAFSYQLEILKKSQFH